MGSSCIPPQLPLHSIECCRCNEASIRQAAQVRRHSCQVCGLQLLSTSLQNLFAITGQRGARQEAVLQLLMFQVKSALDRSLCNRAARRRSLAGPEVGQGEVQGPRKVMLYLHQVHQAESVGSPAWLKAVCAPVRRRLAGSERSSRFGCHTGAVFTGDTHQECLLKAPRQTCSDCNAAVWTVGKAQHACLLGFVIGA